jgi:membrane protease YdiL (CAAX protease family)
MTALIRRYPVTGFYLLAYLITWTIALPLLLAKRGLIAVDVPHLIEPVAAFGPFIAAMLVARALSGRDGPRSILQSLGHWRVGGGWLAVSLLSPVALLGVAVVVAGSISAGEDFATPSVGQLSSLAGLFDLVIVGGVLQAWGEEPGWRGFALPRLRERFGPLPATLALWPVWLCWHLPFFLSRPEFGWAQWAAFSVGILSAAIWLTLIWEGTRSILMCIGWHAAVNICRGTALAFSTAAFLVISNLVLLGALVIAVWWAWRARRGSTASPTSA